jgi:trehalose-6-phosphate synthase
MKYIIATARAPYSHDRVDGKEVVKQNVGGVASSLRRLMNDRGGTWVCWGDGSLDTEYQEEITERYTVSRIILGSHEKRGFYDNFSNGTLWPLFHYFREKIKTDNLAFEPYITVNRKFAERIAKYANNDTVIWVHDYQLSLVPGMVRRMLPASFIVMTWHIPWVAGEFFSILPQAKQILESLTSSNMITFHTDVYVRNFLETHEQTLGSSFLIKNKVIPIPLGIDDKYYATANNSETRRKSYPIRKTIFSIDRLDYTKGLKNRVMAVEHLLTRHPDLKGKFNYVMLVTPSRTTVSDYILMKRELEMNIGRVNGRFGDLEWTPIIYMYRKISDNVLKSHYRFSDIALITPLIDGLNLVAKEFAAASEDGVLILSKFAGASADLRSAIIVNPYDVKEMADSLYTAINMSPEERKSRLADMKAVVRRKNSSWWLSRIEKEILKRRPGEINKRKPAHN